MSAIDTVIFDLGNVLIPWDPRRLYRTLIADEARMAWFLTEVCNAEWNALQDAGRSLAEGTAALISAYPECEAWIRAYYDRWEEMLDAPIDGSVALLQTFLDRGLRVYALTNWSAETFARARPHYPLLGWFHGIVMSGEERVNKPDPALYRILFDRYDVNPAQAAFIDDSLPNVEAARHLGLNAIHFRSPGQAREAFSQLGLL